LEYKVGLVRKIKRKGDKRKKKKKLAYL